ncbi:hypothetical protein QBC33DRAFT_534969 [Phialemonium atrogriseum]|uniref:Uncharacterized protein n=1 Tax=Phialemonium atrogriseum TaxID=1093897 RepID=A0AAJ0C3J4_9PEZI|nr:uncharacterized protein QBC33DRAFT_534969 [Phialemonium atrogriseum]KAK1768438.1 hypothetical protein QBC33DRAFT_534969 [Phialemonium atrogriseum]
MVLGWMPSLCYVGVWIRLILLSSWPTSEIGLGLFPFATPYSLRRKVSRVTANKRRSHILSPPALSEKAKKRRVPNRKAGNGWAC